MGIVEKFIKEGQLTKEEYPELLHLYQDPDAVRLLREEAVRIQKKYFGNKIYTRGLIEFTNYCRNDCYYCGIRRSNRNASRYRLTKEEILQCCENGYELGFRTFVLQGGEDPWFNDDRMVDIIRSIKQGYPDCAITLSIGEKSKESYQKFKEAGAEPVFFSPLHDKSLPQNIGGLYLPGGYPELYAKTLSENKTMLASIRQAVQAGLPTAAECGGFLYLGRSLEDADGKAWPMADVLPGDGIRVGRLVRFGYAEMTAKADSMLFCAGETLPIHEFHHWDSTANGTAFTACKNEKMQWECGFANENFYAGFPHLYWAGTPLPGRFVRAAERYSKTKG